VREKSFLTSVMRVWARLMGEEKCDVAVVRELYLKHHRHHCSCNFRGMMICVLLGVTSDFACVY
jgi:hypothetical protein